MDAAFVISAFQESQYPPADMPEIAFAGRSNVGKSSLINTLVNRKKLAKISAKPGRTQSINFFRVGKSFYLVDLPGYGFAKVPIAVKKSWQLMVETYLRKRMTLKAVIVILDIRRELSTGDMDLLNWLNHYAINAILVLTKADKVSRQKALAHAKIIDRQLRKFSASASVVFSAKTRQGREEVWEEIRKVIT